MVVLRLPNRKFGSGREKRMLGISATLNPIFSYSFGADSAERLPASLTLGFAKFAFLKLLP